MIYCDFTEETKQYLKSLRFLKEYVSFDIYLKTSWVIPKVYVEQIEVIQQENSDRKNTNLYSFVVLSTKDEVQKLESAIKKIFKYNRDREEKEFLFKEKIDKLKKMFETTNVEELKGLDFVLSEPTVIALNSDEQQTDTKGDGGHDALVQQPEVEG